MDPNKSNACSAFENQIQEHESVKIYARTGHDGSTGILGRKSSKKFSSGSRVELELPFTQYEELPGD